MDLIATLTRSTALGAGLAGGGFLVFSTFVLQGLDALPADRAVAAMRQINRRAVNPLFMLTIFGTAVAALALVVAGLTRDGADDVLRVAGAVLYLVGAVGVTVVGNVPLNRRLDALGDPGDPGDGRASTEVWAAFRSRWLAFNHVRTLSAAVACGVLLSGLGG